jgi:tetratricopeptide (TPR) repeat protein
MKPISLLFRCCAGAVLLFCLCGTLSGCSREIDERRLGLESAALGDHPRAVQHLERGLYLAPSDTQARHQLARSLQRWAFDEEWASMVESSASDTLAASLLHRAEGELRILQGIAPASGQPSLCRELAQVLSDQARLSYLANSGDDAVWQAERSLELDSSAVALELLGLSQLLLGREPLAIAAFEKLTSQYPATPRGWLLLGRIAWEAGRSESALASWANGLELNPKDAELRYWQLEAMDALGYLK